MSLIGSLTFKILCVTPENLHFEFVVKVVIVTKNFAFISLKGIMSLIFISKFIKNLTKSVHTFDLPVQSMLSVKHH